MYYVILASTYKNYGHTTSILGITTEEDKIPGIIEEAVHFFGLFYNKF